MNFLQNFGRLHPLLVHLPIGFLLLVLLIELVALKSRFSFLKAANNFILLLGALTAILACILGYYLSLEGGYDHETLEDHEHAGIALAVIASLAFIIKMIADKYPKPVLSKTYHVFVFLFVPLLMLAGHYGGSLTHGSDYLANVFNFGSEETVISVADTSATVKVTDINEAMVYVDVVYPILEEKCAYCHNSGKSKGAFMMHTPELLLKGGANGIALVSGFPVKSMLYHRIQLPEEHKLHMPPKGKDQLTPDEIQILEWWIASGAEFNKKVSQLTLDEENMKLIKKTLGIEDEVVHSPVFDQKMDPADAKLLASLNKEGIKVLPIDQTGNFLSVNAISKPGFNDDDMKKLLPIAKQIVWLDVKRSKISDKALETVAQMPNLIELHLDNTQVTDAGLSKLTGLKYLEYINLYKTKTTKNAPQALKKVTTLKKLYTS
jgi:uncharacterized membrane protein